MSKILIVVALLFMAYQLNLNQDCDGKVCNVAQNQIHLNK